MSAPPNAATPAVQPPEPKILWSCVARNNVILAEAASSRDQAVAETAKELLAKKATPGFEFHTQSRFGMITSKLKGRKSMEEAEEVLRTKPLKAVKFHLYEHVSKDDHDCPDTVEINGTELRMWVFCAVYDSTDLERAQVQSFLEKIVTISENFREHDPAWKYCDELGLQDTFAPILKQRMEEVSYLGQMAVLEDKVQACQTQMERNIRLLLEQTDKIEDLQEDATRLEEMALVFKKNAKKAKRYHMMKNAKHGLILGTAVTTGIAVVVVPPLVAIL